MGIGILLPDETHLPAFRGFFPVVGEKGNSSPAATREDVPPASTIGASSLDSNRGKAIQTAYDAIVYTNRVTRMSISGSLISNTSLIDDKMPEMARTGQQFEFSFVNELREEALVLFQRRTQAVAGNLGETQRSSYIEASRSVAARFEASFKMSAEALNGFAAASEGAQDNEAVMNRFLELVNKLFEKSSDLFNEVMGLLGGFSSGVSDTQDSLASFQQLFEEMFAQFFGGNTANPATGSASKSAGIQLEFKFSFELSIEVSATEGQVQQSDPLVFDLDGDGIELTRYLDGARFDLLGDGRQVQTAFVTGGDAFLAIDRNGNEIIDSGKELFGEQNGARNGFEELRKLDTNGDGVIDRRDRDFDALRLFRDNGNGITEEGELLTLAQAGIESINLGYVNTNQRAAGGNTIAQIASFQRAGGAYGRVADALLNYLV